MKRAQADLKEIHFDNPRLAKVGVETLTLKELRGRAGAALLSTAQRVDFHHLLLVQEGRGKHMVDFIEHGLRPGAVLVVRPGQVQRWRLRAGLQGQLALISAEALAPSVSRLDMDTATLTLNEWPTVSTPDRVVFDRALDDVGRLRADIARFDGGDIEAAIVRHELATLLLRLARELRSHTAPKMPTREAEIYRLFARELEARFATRLSVLDYAERLGFSESTLSRACIATVGRSAKQEIDRRVALEAKRLLVHSQATVVQIGHWLGFTEPTNFVKFFKRNAGGTPLEFRSSMRR